MNTKFLLLLLAALLISSKTSPAVIGSSNRSTQKNIAIVRPYITNQVDELSFNDDGQDKSDSKHHVEKKHPHHDEDGKHEHHVSGNRFGRRRRLIYQLCKLALIIAYAGSFLYSFQAVIHMPITRYVVETYHFISSHWPF